MFDNYPQVNNAQALSPVQEPQRQRLEREKKFMSNRMADIDRALSLFAKYPELEELTDILRRV